MELILEQGSIVHIVHILKYFEIWFKKSVTSGQKKNTQVPAIAATTMSKYVVEKWERGVCGGEMEEGEAEGFIHCEERWSWRINGCEELVDMGSLHNLLRPW